MTTPREEMDKVDRLRREAARDEQRAHEMQGMLADMHAEVERLREESRDLTCTVAARENTIKRLRREREQARETIKKLNRRATTAEAGVCENIETLKKKGMPLGRRLAHAGYGVMERERDAALARVAELEAERDTAQVRSAAEKEMRQNVERSHSIIMERKNEIISELAALRSSVAELEHDRGRWKTVAKDNQMRVRELEAENGAYRDRCRILKEDGDQLRSRLAAQGAREVVTVRVRLNAPHRLDVLVANEINGKWEDALRDGKALLLLPSDGGEG